MGKLRKLARGLQERSVYVAEQKQHKQIKLIQSLVAERASKDPEFAKDLLAAVGNNLPDQIREIAQNSIDNANSGIKYLPEDPLIIGNAPESNYPENQGMGNAFKETV